MPLLRSGFTRFLAGTGLLATSLVSSIAGEAKSPQQQLEPQGTTDAMIGGSRIFVPRSEIKVADFVGGRSFMPPSFGVLPDESMADLVAYITTLREGAAPPE